MKMITADQIPLADNPHGVDVRHLHKTKTSSCRSSRSSPARS